MGSQIMKPVLYAVSALLMLSFAGNAALAYSGSECEVNDCSAKPTKAKSGKDQPKAKSKAEAKAEAKTEAKNNLVEKASSQLRDIPGFFK